MDVLELNYQRSLDHPKKIFKKNEPFSNFDVSLSHSHTFSKILFLNSWGGVQYHIVLISRFHFWIVCLVYISLIFELYLSLLLLVFLQENTNSN